MSESLLDIIYNNDSNLLSEAKALLNKGEDPNVITKYAESPLRVASNNGRFDVVKLLLSYGANESQLGWTAVFHAIAYGSLSNLEEVITLTDTDLEHRDFWKRTPFLFSILVGDIKKTSMLIDAGADVTAVGRCGKMPLVYAIQKDNVSMLNWLIAQGFDLEQRDEFENTAIIEASELGSTKCLISLIEKGADILAENHIPEQAISVAKNLDIVTALVNAGADINDINKESRAEMLGYHTDELPEISHEEYRKSKYRVFGKSNPERTNDPFWLAMVRSGCSAYFAANHFEPGRDVYEDDPVWSFDRFGKSITLLPDGRIIEIAGEHEDHYDPDFCIYNDVFVHDGKGHCDIYIYPREIFPPTDFHSATLVDKHIYVIGNLGYAEDRRPNYTQVFRLDIDTLKMDRIEGTGVMPGWICRHKAHYDGVSIITINGGELIVDNNGEEDYIDNKHSYSLCLKSLQWKQLN